MTKACTICGVMTEWRCADCMIGKLHPDHPTTTVRKEVAVCGRPECRDEHERRERHFINAITPREAGDRTEGDGNCTAGSRSERDGKR